MNFKCHNCSMGTTASKVIQYVDPEIHKEYVMERFAKPEEPEYKFDAPKFKKKDPKLEVLTGLNRLKHDHPARQVLSNRKIPEEHYDKFYLCDKWFQWSGVSTLVPRRKEHPRLVIPFRDEDGEVFAAQGRAFGDEKPKYLTVKFEDKPKIFGLDRVDWSRLVYVVEGPIDSLFLDNAIAVAGSDMAQLVEGLDKEMIVAVYDNEPRSREIVQKMEQMVDNDYNIVVWPNSLNEKDINDMTLSGHNPQQIIKENTYTGLQARMALANWKKT
ncbi:MAG: DNA primase [Candidatus Pacebacteria bacterium]|nr:DNA primase [Candidatus Paceibacterota bacterium]